MVVLPTVVLHRFCCLLTRGLGTKDPGFSSTSGRQDIPFTLSGRLVYNKRYFSLSHSYRLPCLTTVSQFRRAGLLLYFFTCAPLHVCLSRSAQTHICYNGVFQHVLYVCTPRDCVCITCRCCSLADPCKALNSSCPYCWPPWLESRSLPPNHNIQGIQGGDSTMQCSPNDSTQ